MGNGPSLLHNDLNALAGEVTIVSNAHYLMWGDLDYVPTYLTVEDMLVAEDRCAELSRLRDVTTIFPLDVHRLMGPAEDRRLYVNFHRQYWPYPRFTHDFTRRVYWGGTVTYLNLQLAAHLGCHEIFLIGFDHNYSVPAGTPAGGVIESVSDDVNHFHPDYFGPGYRWHDPNVARMEQGYRYARAELERARIVVRNATVGGHLEVFERVSFEEVV
jgi:hypothetical protein